MTAGDDRDLLDEQLAYYRARAAEYDQWWFRHGRYDRGPEENARWFSEGEEIAAALEEFRPSGRILEIAGGTGIWTARLRSFSDDLVVLDGSKEMLAINAARVGTGGVRHVQAEIFTWEPDGLYDTVFFSFWLSHVPPVRFDSFWDIVRRSLAPGGRVFFADSRRDAGSTAIDHQLPETASIISRRRLNDGREFDVYKVFHDPAALSHRLLALGWDASIRQTERHFIHGSMVRSADPA